MSGEASRPAFHYIIADPAVGKGWGHIFSEYDEDAPERTVERERTVRFVFDVILGRIIRLDILINGRYSRGRRDDYDDVEESLTIANDNVLESPIENGLLASDCLPAWALPPALSKPYRNDDRSS